MNITLALGLHFDNGPKAPLAGQDFTRQAAPAAGPVIDVLPEPETRSRPASSDNRLLFLTYNFRGISEPVWADIYILDIYA